MSEPTIPAFLLKGAPALEPTRTARDLERKPTLSQLSAAMLAYDLALPPNANRPALPVHIAALRAALEAALSKG